eukprot:8280090-Pyramimonas_sp.AAC.1
MKKIEKSSKSSTSGRPDEYSIVAAGAEPGGPAAHVPVESGGFADGTWAQQNAYSRKVGLRFLEGCDGFKPTGVCVVLRMVYAVTGRVEKGNLYIASDKYERQQQAAAAKRIQDGVARPGELLRDYAALVRARGAIEGKAFRQLRTLMFDTRVWCLVPSAEVT